jgi:hypothetical protein
MLKCLFASEFVVTLHCSFQQLLAVVAGDDELVNGSVSRRESCTVKKSRTGKTKKKSTFTFRTSQNLR